MAKLKVIASKSKFEEVPVGVYQGAFTELKENVETVNGICYRWAFTENGTGREISGLCDQVTPTTKNKLGRWLAAISDKPLTENMEVDPLDYIGQQYMIVVTDTGKGPRLNTFSQTKQD